MPPAPPLRLLHVLQPSHSPHASISWRHPTAKPVNYTSHTFISQQLHEVEQHARHLRPSLPMTLSRPRSPRSSGAAGRSLQVTQWIHSANRRAGQPPRSLGAQHLANCPSIRLISRSPFSCARQLSRRLTASPLAWSPVPRLWSSGRLEKMEKGSCEIRANATGILARSRTAKRRRTTGKQSIGHDTA